MVPTTINYQLTLYQLTSQCRIHAEESPRPNFKRDQRVEFAGVIAAAGQMLRDGAGDGFRVE